MRAQVCVYTQVCDCVAIYVSVSARAQGQRVPPCVRARARVWAPLGGSRLPGSHSLPAAWAPRARGWVSGGRSDAACGVWSVCGALGPVPRPLPLKSAARTSPGRRAGGGGGSRPGSPGREGSRPPLPARAPRALLPSLLSSSLRSALGAGAGGTLRPTARCLRFNDFKTSPAWVRT